MQDDFSDAALVLAGHGSTLNPESSAPVYHHADALRRTGIFAQVLECFWKLEPGISGVLRGVFAPRAFVVPVFISEGYFTEEVIPRELGLRVSDQPEFARVQERSGRRIHYCGPIGTHPRMASVIVARAQEVVRRHPFPQNPPPAACTLFVAGHGTGNNENSRKAIEQQVELIRAQGLYAGVQGIFLEESPFISQCYEMAQTRHLVVVPFFISDGLHSIEDIPVMLGETERAVQERYRRGRPTWRNPTEKRKKLVWYSKAVGSEPLVREVILERVREAAAAG